MITESQNIEFKENWRDEYQKWICGFANAQGGTLYIGLRDNGEVCGVQDARKLMEDIPNKVRDMMGILVDVNLKEKDKMSYLEIVTEAYPYPISFRGKYYQRSGATNQELKGAALDRFMLRRQGKTWDGVPVPYLKAEDLDDATFDMFRNKDYANNSPIQIRVYENKLEIINGGSLPDDWTIDTLLSSHSSQPYNPSIANTFFRAGEIEAWGRGIERIIAACKNDGFSTPEFRYDASGIWTIFRFEYPERAMIQNMPETIQKTMQKTIQKQLSKQQETILIYLSKHPDATRNEQVENIPDATMGGIIYNLSRLQELGLLKRVGGRKQGYWQIVES